MSSRRLLICTDLDRTLIPNGRQPESPGARDMLTRLVTRPEVQLAFASGRHQALVENAISEFDLPVPDYVIGDVGTTIYQVGPEHLWKADPDWAAHIAGDWGDRRSQDLALLIGEVDGLWLQPDERQNRHKLSYFSDPGIDTDHAEQVILAQLEAAQVRARLVWSVEERGDDPDRGLLDVLPISASKYHALRALMAAQGLGIEDTVFCGDSGNDLEVLVSPVPAVLVANAGVEVRSLATRLAADAGQAHALYLARGGFAGMNGNYAAGMLEGVAHFRPDVVQWMTARAGAA